MHPVHLIQTLLLTLWLAYITRSSHCLGTLNITYRSVPKLKRHNKQKKSPVFFSKSVDIPSIETQDIKSFTQSSGKECFSRSLGREIMFDKDTPLFLEHLKFLPEYGVMFNDLGTLVPGLKQMYLFVSVDIPVSADMKQINIAFPDCEEWAGANLLHWHGTEINQQPIRELIHQHVCGEMNVAYRDLYAGIQEDWQQLSHIMNQQIPAFLPNRIIHSSKGPRMIVGPSGHIWYSRQQYKKEP